MRLLRFVAVACMVAVSVASLGCGEQATETAQKSADTTVAKTEAPSVDAPKAEKATTGTTPVSLTVTGMS